MPRATIQYLYTIKLNDQYGWLVSTRTPDDFEYLIDRSVKSKQNFLYGQEPSQIEYLDATPLLVKDNIALAQLVISKLANFTNHQLIGQKIHGLYFYGANFKLNSAGNGFTGSGQLQDLLKLMQMYSRIDFGWPKDAGKYRQEMNYQGDENYQCLRAAILTYWYQQCNHNLDWLEKYQAKGHYTPTAAKNYLAAYRWLWQNGAKDIRSWYYDTPSHEVGLVWHFTDMTNMVSILSRLKIDSKNQALKGQLMQNDNAASSVNNAATQDWVHDYARFYLRPQTPTQYRNEGIYQYYDFQTEWAQIPKSLKDRSQQRFWTNGRLAHLPVPVFIGFSLEDFLKRGGFVTTRELAGRSVSTNADDMMDTDLIHFKNCIDKIYGRYKVPTLYKQTEFVFPQSLEFNAKDILRIVVRNEAEKIILLTLLAEAEDKQYSTVKDHRKVSMLQYFDRIVVDPTFFNPERTHLQISENSSIHFAPAVHEDNQKLEVQPYSYVKPLPDGRKERFTIAKLKQLTMYVLDINHEYKQVARIHDPYWILQTDKWYPRNRYAQQQSGINLANRYYSIVYLNHQIYKIYRPEGQNEWYNREDNLPFKELTDEKRKVLRAIEESYHSQIEE